MTGVAQTGLVLEGGGMRAAYTAGVLDAFLDETIYFAYVIGVSAGANAGSDYVARQRERNHKVFVDFVPDSRYAGPSNLLRERSWFGMDFLFESLPDRLAPFDYAAFKQSDSAMVVAVTDCTTGAAAYYCQRDYDPRWFIRTVQRASSSLPILSPPVDIDGRLCLDGGIADPIPLHRAFADGCRRNVVVLTRNEGYRKTPPRLGLATRVALARYPWLRRAMAERHLKYNATQEQLTALESTGEVFVLRPRRTLEVGRMERDAAKLDVLYRQGYEETIERVAELRRWLEKGSFTS